MMKEKLNRVGYLIYIFDRLINNVSFGVKLFLEYYNDKYEAYKDDVIEALDYIFELHPIQNVFVIRAEYKQFNFPDLESNKKIVTKLYELTKERPDDYRPFFCLKCITSLFPFIFSSNPQEVIDLVLPKLDDFHLLFDKKPEDENKEQEEKRINKFKTSFAAFSFLFAALNSVKIIDFFIIWYATHYKKLTKSQLYCFNIIISILFNADPETMKIYLYKYNFAEMFTYLMKMKIETDFFGQNLNYCFYSNIDMFYKNIYDNMEVLILIETELGKIDNFFAFYNDNRNSSNLLQSIFSSNLTNFLISDEIKQQNQSMFLFIKNIEKYKEFYVNFPDPGKNRTSISNEQVNSFIKHYNKLIPKTKAVNSPIPQFSYKLTSKIFKFLYMKPKWVEHFISESKKFPILFDHYKMLNDTYKEIFAMEKARKLSKSNTNEDDLSSNNLHLFSQKHLYNEKLLKAVIEKMSSFGNNPLNILEKLIQSMCVSSTNTKGFISIIREKIILCSSSENNNSVDVNNELIMLTDALMQVVKKNLSILPSQRLTEFLNHFFEETCNKMIDIFLQPQFRTVKGLLNKICQLLTIFPIKLPNNATHLIGFMFLTKGEKTSLNAISLCSKFKVQELSHIEIIQNAFDSELSAENPRFNIINSFLRSFPSVGNARKAEMFERLTRFMAKYEENLKNMANKDLVNDEDELSAQRKTAVILTEIEDISDEKASIMFGCPEEIENDKLAEDITALLDFLCPGRNAKDSFRMSDSLTDNQQQNQNNNYKFYPIPQFIFESLPAFWHFFDEHRAMIDFILLKKFQMNKVPDLYDISDYQMSIKPHFTSKLVSQFPECFSFEFRSTYFHQKMRRLINDNLVVTLKIDQKRIVSSSFRQLAGLPLENWLGVFNIIYNDNIGDDQGGLTRDWLTRLSRAFFRPKSDIFECLENNENYIIRQVPNSPNELTLKMYRFTGMIIARALIQSELISAHLARPLLKQLLHHEVGLKDLEDVDVMLFKSLVDIQNSKIDECASYDLYFDVGCVGGETVELVPNGSTIKVTDANKGDYIKLMAEYRLKKSVEKQLSAFCSGFDALMKHSDIRIFTPNELCLLICGVAEIDVEDLRRNVQIMPPYSEETPVVRMFFEVIASWDKQNLTKLLMFITGSSRMPGSGFKFFVDIRRPITIERDPEKSHYPIAHTCMNTIDLPEYDDIDELNRKLLISINEESFNLK